MRKAVFGVSDQARVFEIASFHIKKALKHLESEIYSEFV